MPRVSVIVNCYNGEKYLEETLKAISAQTFDDFEIVFWDNCSTDSSAQIAKMADPRLRYFKGDELIPLGNARNKALEMAMGEYISFCDCDDIWEDNKLELQVKELDRNKKAGMVFSNFKRLNMLSGKTDVFDQDAKYKVLPFSELVGSYSFCLSSFMIRKEALLGLDHYFNDQFRYAEEFELFSRISYSWDTIYLPDPLVVYRIHENMNTLKLQDRIGLEYNIALENLRKLDAEIDRKYPEVIKRICFARDLSFVKNVIKSGENRKVRSLMRPYLGYNKRALCFYAVSFLPSVLSIKIVNLFYKHRI